MDFKLDVMKSTGRRRRHRDYFSLFLFYYFYFIQTFRYGESFVQPSTSSTQIHHQGNFQIQTASSSSSSTSLSSFEEEWTSDFDGFIGGDVGGDEGSSSSSSSLTDYLSGGGGGKSGASGTLTTTTRDLTAVRTRLFSLGEDLIINDYVGNMGFEEVTDWQYYYEDVDEDGNPISSSKAAADTTKTEKREIVNPNPFDKSKPKRTRTNSGSVVRVFRGNFVGRLGGSIRSKGLDSRILIKEFTGTLAQQLARGEQMTVAELQSSMMEKQIDFDEEERNLWIQSASSRSVLARTDDKHVTQLIQELNNNNNGGGGTFLGILREVNLAELLDDEDGMDPNDFYRALGVPPPKPDAIWIVYEYQGLNTVASYTMFPPEIRRSKQPPKKSFWGGYIEPDPLPKFEQRSNYIVKGIMAQSLKALATTSFASLCFYFLFIVPFLYTNTHARTHAYVYPRTTKQNKIKITSLHEAGITHRSIGRNSLIITSPSQDKAETSSIYFTRVGGLTIKLSDFGFAGSLEDSTNNEEFIARARSFGLSLRKGDTNSLVATNFAMAEDLHALGFVFLGLLLVSLSDLKTPNTPMPPTDEDTMQKLLTEIFDQDFDAFRDYVEAEDVWSKLVDLLDEKDGAGWNVLETLFKAREKTVENRNTMQVVTARGLLSNRFFQ